MLDSLNTAAARAHIAYLAWTDRLQAALNDRERGDGGPIPTAVIIAAVLAAALVLALVIKTAVQNHSRTIK